MTVREEVMRAYGDSNEYGFATRNLDFRASESVSPADAAAIMRLALADTGHSYNNFTADILASLPEMCRIELARERSVCVYVQGDLDSFKWAHENLVDECSEEEGGWIRFWWD